MSIGQRGDASRFSKTATMRDIKLANVAGAMRK
jgi:hypothetical protein